METSLLSFVISGEAVHHHQLMRLIMPAETDRRLVNTDQF
jgi:hypothetical protein